jgi:hypothetical protein
VTSEELTPAAIKAGEIAQVVKSAAEMYPSLRLEEGVGSYYATVDSVDDLLDDLPEAVGLMEMTGKVIVIHDATLRIGEMDDRTTVFAVIDTTDAKTGERFMTTTGASAVLGQINKAKIAGWLPLECKPYQVGLGTKGRTDPLHLGKVDRPDGKPAPKPFD